MKKGETEEQPPAKMAKTSPPAPPLTICEPTGEAPKDKEPEVQGKGKGILVVAPKKSKTSRRQNPPWVSRENFHSEHFFKIAMPYDTGASGSALGKDMVNHSVRYVNERSPSIWATIRNDDP